MQICNLKPVSSWSFVVKLCVKITWQIINLYSFNILHVIITILSVFSFALKNFRRCYLVTKILIIKSVLVVGTECWETEPRGIQWQQHCLRRRCFGNPYLDSIQMTPPREVYVKLFMYSILLSVTATCLFPMC